MFEGSLIMSTTAAGWSVRPFQKIEFPCALDMLAYAILISIHSSKITRALWPGWQWPNPTLPLPSPISPLEVAADGLAAGPCKSHTVSWLTKTQYGFYKALQPIHLQLLLKGRWGWVRVGLGLVIVTLAKEHVWFWSCESKSVLHRQAYLEHREILFSGKDGHSSLLLSWT